MIAHMLSINTPTIRRRLRWPCLTSESESQWWILVMKNIETFANIGFPCEIACKRRRDKKTMARKKFCKPQNIINRGLPYGNWHWVKPSSLNGISTWLHINSKTYCGIWDNVCGFQRSLNFPSESQATGVLFTSQNVKNVNAEYEKW